MVKRVEAVCWLLEWGDSRLGDGANIGDLAGQTVRMRVELRDADLFAFRFR